MNTRNEHDKQWYLTTFVKAVRFFLLLVMIGIVAIILFSCKGHRTYIFSSDYLKYECPVVADTVKNDWVKDENVCIERRIVYDQMLRDE